MKKLLASLLVIGSLGLTFAQRSSPFVDIPPCHWAAESVGRIAGEPEVDVATARNSVYLAENSLRQVFEGLRCQNAAWSLEFLQGAPSSFTEGRAAMLNNFSLSVLSTDLSGDTATLDFNVQVSVGPSESLSRQGEAELAFVDGRWLVEYSSLAELELPVFPQ